MKKGLLIFVLLSVLKAYFSDEGIEKQEEKNSKTLQNNFHHHQHSNQYFPIEENVRLGLLTNDRKNGAKPELEEAEHQHGVNINDNSKPKKNEFSVSNLCIAGKSSITYKVRNCEKDKIFACIGSRNTVEPCGPLAKTSLCYQPQQGYVVECERPVSGGFCFSNTTYLQRQLLTCYGGKRQRACFTPSRGLEVCRAASMKKAPKRERRKAGGLSKKWKKEDDPTNVNCEDCEVDIIMEVFKDSSTPKVEVKVRKLQGTIPPMKKS